MTHDTVETIRITSRVDTEQFFRLLADKMNAHPERFHVLGDCDMVGALAMRRDDGTAFVVRITFEGLSCRDVSTCHLDGALLADYWLDGPLDAWTEMFDDIVRHGAATGRLTINSLTLIGDRIRLRGNDPMGVDKFSRFNQTLQEYLDGAAHI